MTEEHLTLLVAVGQRTEALRQTPLGHHVARDLGGALNVVRCPGGHRIGTEDQFFGNTPAHHA